MSESESFDVGYKEVFICALATGPDEHNARKYEREAEQDREDIAEPGEGRGRVRRWRKHGVDDACGAPGKFLHHVAASIDHGADAGRRCAQHGETLLGCS